MTKELIEQAAAEWPGEIRLAPDEIVIEIVDFAISQVNAALSEAQIAVDSPRAAEAIEACKVVP